MVRALITVLLAAGLAAACGGGGNNNTGDQSSGSQATTATALAGGRSNDLMFNPAGTPVIGGAALGTPGAMTALTPVAGNPSGTPGASNPSGQPGQPASSTGLTPGAAATSAAGSGQTPEPAGTVAVTPLPGNGLTFSLDAPPSAAGTLSVTLNIAGATQPYFGFNTRIEYDPALLKPTGSQDRGLLGTPDTVFCINQAEQEQAGTTFMSCLSVAGSQTTASGPAVTFTFQVLAAGNAGLHITTWDEGADTWGAFVMTTPGENPQAMAADTKDATVAVTP